MTKNNNNSEQSLPVEHQKSCGFLILRRKPSDDEATVHQCLILKHAGGRFDIPKGRVELNEVEERETAARELREETGITEDMIQVDVTFSYQEEYSYVRTRRRKPTNNNNNNNDQPVTTPTNSSSSSSPTKIQKTLVVFLAHLKPQQQSIELALTEHQGYTWVDLPLTSVIRIQQKTIDPLLRQVVKHLKVTTSTD